MVYVPTKERCDTKVIYKKSAAYQWQLEDGIEEYIKLNMGIVE